MSKYNFKSIAPIAQRPIQNVVKKGSIIFIENNQLPKPDESPSPTPSITPTITPSISITATPSITPSITSTPSITPSITSTPSITPTITPSISISITPSVTITPSITPTVTVTPSITPTVTVTPTVTPTVTITPTPSITPSIPSVVQVINKLYYGVNSSAACANVVTLADFAYVYIPVNANPFIINRPWYADSSLTTPYPDGYYALHDIFNTYDGYYAQISGGVVSQSGICPSPSPTPSVTITPSKTPSVTPTVTPTVTPSISVTPSVTPSSVSGVTFSQAFTQSVAPTTTIETAWNTFRASLTGTYTQFVWSSTNGNSITVSHPTLVQTLANALRNATNNTSVTINSVVWRVGTGCGTPKIGGVAVELSNISSCSASSTYALRPMINNGNWGGTNQSTVNAPSQTITLTFS